MAFTIYGFSMRVWYGYSKLTPKVVRKREMAVYFENAANNSRANEEWIERRIRVVYVRQQAEAEIMPAEIAIRMFTKYSYLIDEKPYYGDIEKVLEHNFIADRFNVSAEVRIEIREKLRTAYYEQFNIRKPIANQLKLSL